MKRLIRLIESCGAAALLLVAVAMSGCADKAVVKAATSEESAGTAGTTASVEASAASEPASTAEVTAAEPKITDEQRATPAAATPGQRPPADRTPVRAGDAEKITFEDLNLGIQADVVFRPFMLNDRVKELDGKRVSLTGYMHPGVESTRGIHEFVLLRNKECKFGPGGQADHLAQVFMKKGSTTDFTPGAVKVEATLKVEPFQGPDGNTWSIYRLEEAVVR